MTGAQFPLGIIEKKPASGAVLSVEKVTVTMPYSGSSNQVVEVALTKGQVWSQCICFYSLTLTDIPAASTYWGSIDTAPLVEIVNNSGAKVRATRYEGSRSPIVIDVYVVEFYAGIRVQKITATSSAATVDITIPTAVTMNKTFITLAYQTSVGGLVYQANEHAVRAELYSTTKVRCFRNSTYLSLKYVCYVVEDINDKHWNVQHFTASLTGNNGSTLKTLTTFNPGKSMLWVSYDTTGTYYFGARDANGTCRVLSNGTQVELKRIQTGASATQNFRGQLIEFIDQSVVQHSTANLTRAATNTDVNVQWTNALSPSVDPDFAIPWMGVHPYYGNNVASDEYNAPEAWNISKVRTSIDSGGATIRHQYMNNGSLNITYNYQVITWDLS